VRIAESVYNSSTTNIGDELSKKLAGISSGNDLELRDYPSAKLAGEQKKVLDKVAEALARLGRVKRVALSPKDKISFVKEWERRHRS
jgi:1-acylglycerol-3-phosphate O-acyltransferase